MHRGQTWMWIVMLGMWLAILAALAGCGGATSHQIITDYKGSLQGMVVAPPNGARDVDTRVKPRIAWRGDAQPPAVFSVSLKYQRQGGDFDPVRTRLERLGEKEWQLVPTFPLSSGTLHAIVVTAPNERVESWFITEGDPVHFRSAPPRSLLLRQMTARRLNTQSTTAHCRSERSHIFDRPARRVQLLVMSSPIGREVLQVPVEEEMKRSYLDYAMSVIIARALPDVRDGLKPVQRRILYVMRELGLTPDSQHTKSAKVCGETTANYHPHGQEVVYPTLVRMAQDFNMRYPLVDGQGNFGSVDGDPPAAMRYTEVRLTPIAMEMLADIDKETVDWMPNYLQSAEEPTVLPARFPNLLCNGGSGIAVGMATNIPPHNLSEVVDALIYRLEHPNCTLEPILKLLPGPDFPTGALILGTKGIRQAYETGRGSIVMQAKTQIEPLDGGKSAIVITELPYQVSKARLIEQIAALVKAGKLDGITDLADYSDRTGMRVVIELRRDVNPNRMLNSLLKHTQMRTTFGAILLALVDNVPRVMSLLDLLDHYLEHRRTVIERRTRYELYRAKSRAHILEGLQIALNFLDEIIRIIRQSETAEAARREMIRRFALTVLQADAILNTQLRQLARLEQEKLADEYRGLLREITRLEHILSDPKQVEQIIKDDLRMLKEKFGDARRTRIIAREAEDISEEELIPEEETLVLITRDGYIKRVSLDAYRSQKRGGKGVIATTAREEDEVEHLFQVSTHHYILFFTDRGRVYRLKAYEIPETSRQARGTAVINYINIQPDEKVTATVSVRDFASEGYLTMITRGGEIKRTALSEFANLRSNGLNAFDLESGDSLGWVLHTSGTDDVLLVTRAGLAIRFPESDVPVRGRTAGGVKAIRLGKDDALVAACRVQPDALLLVVSENGFGKCTPLTEYRVQSRGGKGIFTMNVTRKTGSVVAAEVVEKDDKVILVTANGKGIRLRVADLRITGRIAQGVKLIDLAPGDTVAAITRIVLGKRLHAVDASRNGQDESE
jgi:DNA gyrase subunit A